MWLPLIKRQENSGWCRYLENGQSLKFLRGLYWMQASGISQWDGAGWCWLWEYHCSPIAPKWMKPRVFIAHLPVNGFCPHPLSDNCSDLNSELQRVLTGLESVVCGRKKSSCNLSVAEVDRHIEQLTTASEHCDLAIKVGLPTLCLAFWGYGREGADSFLDIRFLEYLLAIETHINILSHQLKQEPYKYLLG